MTANGAPRQRFAANLLSVRTLAIFAAGFLLALFLARTLPDAGLFHPEGRIVTKDIVITALNGIGPSPADVQGIATSEGQGFAGSSEVWDGDLLSEAIAMAQVSNNFRLDARIIYVIPPEGAVTTIRIERRD